VTGCQRTPVRVGTIRETGSSGSRRTSSAIASKLISITSSPAGRVLDLEDVIAADGVVEVALAGQPAKRAVNAILLTEQRGDGILGEARDWLVASLDHVVSMPWPAVAGQPAPGRGDHVN
jgi:hypothetical protein